MADPGLLLAATAEEATEAPFRTAYPSVNLFRSNTENPIIAKTRSIPAVQYCQSAARFPVTRYRVEKGQSIVEYQEYGLSWRPLLRVVLNDRQEVLSVGWIEH